MLRVHSSKFSHFPSSNLIQHFHKHCLRLTCFSRRDFAASLSLPWSLSVDARFFHSRDRVGVLVAEDPLSLLEHISLYCRGLVELALASERYSKVIHSQDRIRVLVAKDPLRFLKYVSPHCCCLVKLALVIEFVRKVA
jgi:hypothetical protein